MGRAAVPRARDRERAHGRRPAPRARSQPRRARWRALAEPARAQRRAPVELRRAPALERQVRAQEPPAGPLPEPARAARQAAFAGPAPALAPTLPRSETR